MRFAGGVWMDYQGKDTIIVMVIKPVELVQPNLPNRLARNPPMAVGKLLHKHSSWSVIKMPACGNFDDVHFCSRLPRLHPVARLFRVIDLCPTVPLPKIMWMKVVFHHAAVVFNAPREQQINRIRT